MNKYEFTLPLSVPTYMFVGKKPAAILFGEERVDVKSWREVYAVIIGRCNQDEQHHQTLMYLRDKIAGKVRMFLPANPKGMTRPLKIDDGIFCETHYGSSTLLHILTQRILSPVGYDYSHIKIILKD